MNSGKCRDKGGKGNWDLKWKGEGENVLMEVVEMVREDSGLKGDNI